MIDLRSDTVTRPTAAMRAAMASAPVGDDVLGDDPTVAALETRVAELLGKEAAVFMPSGTMSNQAAIRAHTQSGDEVFLDANAHCYYYEVGGPAVLSGTMCRLVEGTRGIFTAEQLAAAIRPANIHFPRPRLVCLENTHNRGGGSIWPVNQIAAVEQVARQHGLAMHLDGARLWNASAATGIPERQYAKHFDSVSVCFSKGLGAPIGSALVGGREFIDRARWIRKLLGGGMRQVGIIAAGALYAVEHNRARLAEDHAHARRLAEALGDMRGVRLDPASVQTNLVVFELTNMPADAFVQACGQRGVAVISMGPSLVRAVTHLDVSAEQIEQAIEIMRGVLYHPAS